MLNRQRRSSLWLILFLAASLLHAAPIRPGEPWFDAAGARIQAHGGGITRWQGVYYWFGEDRTPGNDPSKRYVGCYSSRDLARWTSCGQVLQLADPEQLGPNWVLERPKVYADPRTHRFVLYAHLDDARYKLARVMVAVSDRITGPYTYVKSFRPLGEESRDIGQFVDDDGAAYLIFESRPTHGFFIAKLSEDFMSVEKTAFIEAPLEGGAIAHVGGLYYVIGSHMSGWRPNPNVYATASSLVGPWTSFENLAPAEANNYESQSTMLLAVKGAKTTSVIFMGDIWKPKSLWDSRYFWMPLVLDHATMKLPAPRPWTINVKTGATTLLPAEATKP